MSHIGSLASSSGPTQSKSALTERSVVPPSPVSGTNNDTKGKGRGKSDAAEGTPKTKKPRVSGARKEKTTEGKKRTKNRSNALQADTAGDVEEDNLDGLDDASEGAESRASSVRPSAIPSEGTPSKKRGVGKGSRGGGRRGAARADSRSTTGGRASASLAPPDIHQAMRQDTGEGVDTYNEEREEGVEDSDEEEDEQNDQGLEEDELDRQEAIQRQRSINMGPLMKSMDEAQQERYSAFRRYYLDKRHVRKIVTHLTAQPPTPQVTTLVGGVGKVFIGEIVEKARQVQDSEHRRKGLQLPTDTQLPLRPEHLMEAYRAYREEHEKPGHYPPGSGVGANGRLRRLF